MSQDPRALLKQAEEKLSRGGGFWGFMSDKSDAYSTAVQLFTSAANAFEKQGSYVEAGKAYERAAEVHIQKLEDAVDGKMCLENAFDIYLKAVDPVAAGRCIKAMAESFRKINPESKDRQAHRLAKPYERMAAMYEVELQDMGAASEMYQAAADAMNPETSPLYACKTIADQIS
ncbi:vesicular-fusion protein S17 [Metarhizium rileyi]|uniref:Gamma-soluble NSF attachment protein n=1 Tax=Metarhizium rileyi (strain RCEF 4871) TaxID=1649241 RepID=A0A5C6GND6_METRR|nr:vesicular-fusion protein S17 [Metarhizium rileyi]